MRGSVPALRLKARSAVHNLVGGRIEPLRRDQIHRARFLVTHWIAELRTGDTIRWNAAKDVDSQRTYAVIGNAPVRGCQGVWRAELSLVQPDVTICGVTYPAPSQGFLVPLMTECEGRFAP